MNWERPRSSRSPSVGRSPTSHKRRSMVKCESCRKKRIKCTPIVRTWPGQRCVPCEEHDFPCGPNVHSRQSTITKLGNTSSPALNIVAGVEPQTAKAGKFSRWECMNGLDCPWSLTDLEADNGDLMNHLLSMPFEESQLQKENWSEIVVGQTDKSSRESLSALPGFVGLTPTADQLEIDQSFIRLGELRIVFEAVESRTRAVGSLAHESNQEPVRHALKFISWCIASRHDAILTNVITLAGRLDARAAEVAFLRALRSLEELDCIDSRVGSARESQIKLRSAIIQRLFDIYTARKDIPEAEYWLRRLDTLPSDFRDKAPNWTAKQLAYSLQSTSKMAQAVLESLELDQDIRSNLRFSKPASFPAIHRAIRAGHIESARILSSVPAALMEADFIGRTALHVAAETGQVASLRAQLTPDAINHRDVFQCTPLFLAACEGNLESFAYLVEMGADTQARTSDGRSILTAARSAGHLEIVQHLLKNGIDPNDHLPEDSGPFGEADSHGRNEICKTPTERSNTAMRPPGVLLASEDNSEVLSDLAPQTPPHFLFSEPPSMSRTSTIGDYEVSTCDWAELGFVDGLSCTKFDVPDFPMGDDILPQLGFCEMGAAEFGTMQNPLEIV